MDSVLRFGAIFVVAVKRLLSERRLAFLTMVGLTAGVALTLSIPLYADAVYYKTLREAVGADNEHGPRPPYAFMFRYIGSWYGPLKWADMEVPDAYFRDVAGHQLGLPRELLTHFYRTDNLSLFPSTIDKAYLNSQKPLTWIAIGAIGDLNDHIVLREGSLPAEPASAQSDTVDVLMADEMAARLGVHAGETYVLYGDRMAPERGPVQLRVRVVGVWAAKDATDEFWFYNPDVLVDVLLVSEASFATQVVPRFEAPVYLALWYMVMDGSGIRAADAAPLLGRIYRVSQQAAGLVQNLSLDISPAEALEKYQSSATLLTILLYAFSIPIIGLILAFIGLVVGLMVGQRRNEIAVLRSRGGTTAQVVGIAAMEAAVLGALALALGWPVSEVFAKTMGRARSFLNFSAAGDLPVQMTFSVMRAGIVLIGVALLAQIVPTISAAGHTVITYKQERARTLRRPWWQRMWLDVILLVPAAYGMYLLRMQGSIALPGAAGALPNDPFQNPLLFLIPALGVLALTLLVLRIMPPLMRLVAWAGGHTGSVGLVLAARYLARSPGFYTAPLVLLVLTLSLSAFTASLAQTLDNHLWDKAYYQVGADMHVSELGESTETGDGAEAGAASGNAFGILTKQEGPRWLFMPVSEYLNARGVEAAARVGLYPATARSATQARDGHFMGVDRVDFGKVAFWRDDFAPESLGGLLNSLALAPDSVLVPASFMGPAALNIGDTIRISVSVFGERKEIAFKIAGVFDLFPTWYPSESELFVGNLDYLYEQVGGQYPYDVWLKVAPGASHERIVNDVRGLGLRVLQWDASLVKIAAEQGRPERQGLFGLLSVGFVAAALLTVLGFLLYALFSFRQRTIELGILRAVGLSSGQMTSFLAWELAFLIGTGLIVGTGTGAWISYLFIPYLQVGSGPGARVPPYIVEIAWPAIFRIYALFGALFVVALVVLAVMLLRMKIFQAIKMGETI